ncbi:hypothetical protein BZA70DRAFT_270670 [Myxozyma melibiosi]|uniref:Uncharacterized protein n=1 Tax=Myxozyma melibiosi TaxID=54550 RepID=A0ABR1FBF6_9ASCO
MAPTPSPVSITTAPPSVWARVSKFVSENKALVYGLSAATFLVVGGAGAYYVMYSDKPGAPPASSPSPSPSAESEKSAETKAVSDKKRKKDKKKAKKEREKAEAKNATEEKEKGVSTGATESSSSLPAIPSDLSGLSEETLNDYSLQYKTAGNAEFKAKNYEQAIDLYTKAISLKKDAVYYNNRAACYNALEQYEKAVEDASKALELDSLYLKALTRRAQAYEKLGNFHESVLDYTAAALLSGTPNDPIGKSIDRMLMQCGEERAKGLLQNKTKSLPSISFVTAYIDSFHKRETPESITGAAEGSGNAYLKQAIEASEKKTLAGHYEALELVNKAIDAEAEDLAWALDMRGTFKFLMADNEGALTDLTESIKIAPSVSALIKRAMLLIELGDPAKSNQDFDTAVAVNPEDPDIYYHRGQVHFLLGEYDDAAKDYQKAIDLDKEFMSAHVQLAVTQYKLGAVIQAMTNFKKCTKNFPEAPDVFNYYGELLMDNQKLGDAVEMFDRAFELEKKRKSSDYNVLPLINKAYILWTFKQGTVEDAEKLLKTALELDPQSDLAVGTLAQLMMTQNRMEEALGYFEKQLELSRTENEIMQAASYVEAVNVQIKLLDRYPLIKERLQQQQQAMSMQM